MKHRHSRIFGLLVVLFFMVVSIAQAAVPGVMTYKGELLDAGGQPVTGTNAIDFKLYSVENGGAAFWSETQTVSVAAGSFTVQLGANPANLIDDTQLGSDTWLGITVAGGTEMTPRQKMTSVAYSLRAKVAESVTSSDSLIPAGSIMAYAGTTAPAGWMFCNGDSIDRSTYSKLFTAIGTSHGSTSGTTFNVPDYRGRFLRGVDHAAGRDADRTSRTANASGGNTGDAVGSVQGVATKLPTTGFSATGNTNAANGVGAGSTSGGEHSHPLGAGAHGLYYYGSSAGGTSAAGTFNTFDISMPHIANTEAGSTHTHTLNIPGLSLSASINGGGDSETRPVNANVEYIIKY